MSRKPTLLIGTRTAPTAMIVGIDDELVDALWKRDIAVVECSDEIEALLRLNEGVRPDMIVVREPGVALAFDAAPQGIPLLILGGRWLPGRAAATIVDAVLRKKSARKEQ